mmetsp:Transcript_4906/g.14311  ORF Transcript_4906/g.14311 Transcript_4906/m.14311 type:complete len:200 (-) Transcript_4906:1070-1669(-)
MHPPSPHAKEAIPINCASPKSSPRLPCGVCVPWRRSRAFCMAPHVSCPPSVLATSRSGGQASQHEARHATVWQRACGARGRTRRCRWPRRCPSRPAQRRGPAGNYDTSILLRPDAAERSWAQTWVAHRGQVEQPCEQWGTRPIRDRCYWSSLPGARTRHAGSTAAPKAVARIPPRSASSRESMVTRTSHRRKCCSRSQT